MTTADHASPPITTPASPTATTGDHLGRDEGGYVLALLAVALLPLVAVAALSVDFAVWLGRGAELQRAADAAVLAAVPALPSLDGATHAARGVAAANGVVHGEAGVDVRVEVVGASRARVTIRDSSLRRVFSLAILGVIALERTAEGEWAEPVSLGSPRNFLGTGTLAGIDDDHRGLPGVPASAAEGYWLAINGPCASREQGDWLSAVSEANFNSPNPPAGDRPWRGCTPASDPAVVMVRPDGPLEHRIAIRVPHGYVGGPFTVQLFDAAHCAGVPLDGGTSFDAFTTAFVLRGPVASGSAATAPPLGDARFTTGSHCGDPTTATPSYRCGGGSWSQRWCNLAGVATPEPGATYLLTVAVSSVAPAARQGSNGFAVRVLSGAPAASGRFVPCSTDPHDAAVSYQPELCVTVAGRDWLSITTTGGSGDASFSLAEVGPEYGGSTMEVSLFDIGEGTDAIQLIDPSGSAVGFDWEVVMGPGEVPPTGGINGVVAPGGALDVGGGGTGSCGGGHLQRGPGRLSGAKYNDRMLRLAVALPANPTGQWGGRQWWRVRYRACGTRLPTDRTTWGVWIEGQPVRLVR